VVAVDRLVVVGVDALDDVDTDDDVEIELEVDKLEKRKGCLIKTDKTVNQYYIRRSGNYCLRTYNKGM